MPINADKPHLWKADTRASVAAEQFRVNSGLRSQESVVKALISMMEPFKEACSIPLRFDLSQNHSKDCNVT